MRQSCSLDSFESIFSSRLAMNLQYFAAKEGPGGEKTEEATPKKLDDARKEGQVARSQELTMAFSLLSLFLCLKVLVPYIAENFLGTFSENFNRIDLYANEVFNTNYAAAFINDALQSIISITLPVLIVAMAAALLVNVMQVRWKPTAKPLMPKFNKLSPVSGFKRMFSMDKIVDLLKSMLKIALILYLAYTTLRDEAVLLDVLYGIGNLKAAVALIGDVVINLGLKISLFYLVLGLADFIYQKMKFSKDMRMTKQEIKDEFKQTEGDPHIKGRIRQKMREASQRRMMQKLPEADVVITNPTHLACAIKYDKTEAKAPVLIAKGADHLATRIKQEARDNGIPIVENKPLARMLYTNVELDEEIPEELYNMTAEVLAYVYSLQNH